MKKKPATRREPFRSVEEIIDEIFDRGNVQSVGFSDGIREFEFDELQEGQDFQGVTYD